MLVQIVVLLPAVMIERSMYVRMGLNAFDEVAPLVAWCVVKLRVHE